MATANNSNEKDSTYIFKLLFYLVVGSLWLKIKLKSGTEIPIPFGALIGLLFASHERFQIDRKIEYAVLLVAMFVGFWVPSGLELTLH
jgi:uncharacterized transporter YbjL